MKLQVYGYSPKPWNGSRDEIIPPQGGTGEVPLKLDDKVLDDWYTELSIAVNVPKDILVRRKKMDRHEVAKRMKSVAEAIKSLSGYLEEDAKAMLESCEIEIQDIIYTDEDINRHLDDCIDDLHEIQDWIVDYHSDIIGGIDGKD